MAVRRVVTGTNSEGKSYFVHDGVTPGHVDLGVALDDEVWIDDPANPDPGAGTDPAAAESFNLVPPDGGSRIRVFTFLPGEKQAEDPAGLAAALAAVASKFKTGDVMERDNPGMHTTKTIDYGIILSGEIYLELDEGEVHLLPGDIVVQRGTRHAWRNRSSLPCEVAFVLIDSPNYRQK
jgi:mannose-6-phosphate isomerase-like protein (cupin superfamily)